MDKSSARAEAKHDAGVSPSSTSRGLLRTPLSTTGLLSNVAEEFESSTWHETLGDGQRAHTVQSNDATGGDGAADGTGLLPTHMLGHPFPAASPMLVICLQRYLF